MLGNLYILPQLYLFVVGEWVWGVVSALAGLVGVLSLSVWLLVTRVLNSIPTPDDIEAIGMDIIDAQLEKRGFGDVGGGGGGRKPEGMIEKLLSLPPVQNAISGVIENLAKNQGGMSQYGP